MERCYNCNKDRPVSVVGSYMSQGIEIDIVLCQWCKAASTRRKRALLPKPYINRKGGLKK